jgi:hypothetical protein
MKSGTTHGDECSTSNAARRMQLNKINTMNAAQRMQHDE